MIKNSIKFRWGALSGLGRLFPAWVTNPGLLGAIGQDMHVGQVGIDSENEYDVLLAPDTPLPKNRLEKIVNLHLSPSFFLETHHLFPKKAMGEVEPALALLIRQNTPFSDPEIIWRYNLKKHDSKTVSATLYILKKPTLQLICSALESMGSRVRSVQLQNTGLVFYDNTPAILPAQKFWRRISKTVLALAVIVGLSASYFNYQKRSDVLTLIKAKNIALQDEALALREAATAQEAEAQRISTFLAQLQKDRNVLPLINSLSNLLPDSTWLAQLSLRRADIRVAGFSTDDPSKLMIQLEESPYFQQVVLTGPITRDARSGQNRFEMMLALEPSDD